MNYKSKLDQYGLFFEGENWKQFPNATFSNNMIFLYYLHMR